MKQNFGFMLLLSAASLYAASADEQSTAVAVIAQNPATVLNNMIDTGLGRSSEEARASDMGLIYVAIDNSPDKINSLGQDPAVVTQAQAYNACIVTNPTVQRLTAAVTKLVKHDASQLKRAAALGALGVKYSLVQAKMTKDVIPDIIFPIIGTVKNTIKSNMYLELDEQQQLHFKAAQLSMALNMNLQYALDPTTFDAMFAEELKSDHDGKSPMAFVGPDGKKFNDRCQLI